jgi:DNA-binding CsgD family transcriptional regulator
VLEQVACDLQATAVSLLVIDERDRVLERVSGRDDPGPGSVSTAAPIEDPRTGRAIGAVLLVCRAADLGPLILPYAQHVSRDIAARLVDEAGAAERALLEQFVRVRRASRGPVAGVNERRMLTNAAAAALLGDADRPSVWGWARRVMAGECEPGEQLELASGERYAARCQPVLAGRDVVGALVRLDPERRRRAAGSNSARPVRPTFGWAGLSPAELGVAELAAAGLTNQQMAARLFLSRHTIDFHLRNIFTKLGVRSRVELTRIVLERHTQSRCPTCTACSA